MSTILDTIVAQTRSDLELAKQRLPEAVLKVHVEEQPLPRDFVAALRGGRERGPRVIAELKRASPSKGMIRPEFGVVSLARELEEHGAAALSVLTEPRFFLGSPAYLRAVTANVSVPVLRKDFIVDTYQIYEARVWGADAILLIAAALSPGEFARLHATATELGLSVLSEVHTRDELDVVIDGGARIVGVNSRDLRSFKTDLDGVEAILGRIPQGTISVAESGIQGADDLVRLMAAGADAFLIGETLMRAQSPGAMLDKLLVRHAA